jgi:Transglutaminase-like superfamily
MVRPSARAQVQARARVLSQLGLGGVVQVTQAAVSLARMKRSLEKHGLRKSLGDEYADLFAHQSAVNVANHNDHTARRETRIVRIAAKRVGATCLPSSIVLARRLRACGLNPSVRIGIAKLPAKGMTAHAWVELGGEPVGEDASSFLAFTADEFARGLASLKVND